MIIHEAMYGLPNDAYLELMNTVPFVRLINTSDLSLTLVNTLISSITNVRNKRFRRHNVDLLINYLTSDTSIQRENFDTPFLFLNQYYGVMQWSFIMLYTINAKLRPAKISNHVSVNVLTRDNSPSHVALAVGDSRHFTSCLASGMMDFDPADGYTYEDAYTEFMDALGDTVLDYHDSECTAQFTEYGGVNSHYLIPEYEAFVAGRIIYVTIGEPYNGTTESKGYVARMRVHVCALDPANDTPELDYQSPHASYIVDRLYGDEEYYGLMFDELAKLGKPIHVSARTQHMHAFMTVDESRYVYHARSNHLDVYTDYSLSSGYRVSNISKRGKFGITKRRHSDTKSKACELSYLAVLPTRTHFIYFNRRNVHKSLQYHCPAEYNYPSTECVMNSIVRCVAHRILRLLGVPCTAIGSNNLVYHEGLKGIMLYDRTISWRELSTEKDEDGYVPLTTYKIQGYYCKTAKQSYALLLQRSQMLYKEGAYVKYSPTPIETYNLKLDKWVTTSSTDLSTVYDSDNHVTKYTLRLITKYLPEVTYGVLHPMS
jgi:hypothetical protein